MLHNLVVGIFPKEHARTVIETHFFQLLLRENGEGELIGEDGGGGGIQWGALLSYNFALSLLIVTTNVVVSCCVIYHKNFLFGGLLNVIIVLYVVSVYRHD